MRPDRTTEAEGDRMSQPLLALKKDRKGDFIVTQHPALDPIKAEFPEVFRVATQMLLDFSVIIARWEEERAPLNFGDGGAA